MAPIMSPNNYLSGEQDVALQMDGNDQIHLRQDGEIGIIHGK